jgi:transcriptional regulator with XRE-family HTH domain
MARSAEAVELPHDLVEFIRDFGLDAIDPRETGEFAKRLALTLAPSLPAYKLKALGIFRCTGNNEADTFRLAALIARTVLTLVPEPTLDRLAREEAADGFGVTAQRVRTYAQDRSAKWAFVTRSPSPQVQNTKVLSQGLKDLRIQSNLSASEAARRIGISLARLVEYESEESAIIAPAFVVERMIAAYHPSFGGEGLAARGGRVKLSPRRIRKLKREIQAEKNTKRRAR